MTDRVRSPSRKDVAARAGVSPTTVSLVLNGHGDQVGVAKQTQQRILDAALELRYVPNAAARAMVSQRHLTLGIIAAHPPVTLHVPFFAEFAVAAIAEAARHQHTVKFLPPVIDADAYDVVAVLRDALVDAVLVYGLPQLARSMPEWRMPVVYIGMPEEADELPASQIAAVTSDECGGMREVARHLVELGHADVTVIAGPSRDNQPTRRLSEFAREYAALTGRQEGVRYIDADDWSADAGYAAMSRAIADRHGTTAVQMGNDWMAAGALKALRESNVGVPHDIAVVGFGDFSLSGYQTPPLTTVRWPLRELGAHAVTQLLAQLGGDPEVGRLDLATELIIRESTAH